MERTFDTVLKDIASNPDAHKHADLDALTRCCTLRSGEAATVNNQYIDVQLIAAHGLFAPIGTNGGRACDVREGPCSCGAWHRPKKGT